MENQTKDVLQNWFGRGGFSNNGNDFWLVAEQGYLMKAGSKEPWQKMCEIGDFGELRGVRKIMEMYT